MTSNTPKDNHKNGNPICTKARISSQSPPRDTSNDRRTPRLHLIMRLRQKHFNQGRIFALDQLRYKEAFHQSDDSALSDAILHNDPAEFVRELCLGSARKFSPSLPITFPHSQRPGTAIKVACYNGNADIVKVLFEALDTSKDPQSLPSDVKLQKCLREALPSGNFDLYTTLLDRGAKVEIRNDYNETILHNAGSLEIVKHVTASPELGRKICTGIRQCIVFQFGSIPSLSYGLLQSMVLPLTMRISIPSPR